jgi:hypothetical protein
VERPAGVTAIAVYYFLGAAYACALGIFRLISPGMLNLPGGAAIRNAVAFYGPYRVLIFGFVCGLVGWGLVRLQNWARWAGIFGMVLAIVGLVPAISMARIGIPLLCYGLLIALHAAAGFYLARAPTALDAFRRK